MLVKQEAWAELCEVGRGQIANLRKEAQNMPISLDALIVKESIEAQARGVEQILNTPEAFIKDLTYTIEKITDPQGE